MTTLTLINFVLDAFAKIVRRVEEINLDHQCARDAMKVESATITRAADVKNIFTFE
jgi:hypothetical protein